ncbi:uncharacterized protein C6orf203-like isoform X3 [Orbicella faveolata]|uniref:uncharacterized protein C6orf203-like isoform X3 n=1 Tax=Orbicella faveolata TaxID=48498 RepID=UPI0009E54205|nr:uncharacterized protein C6orf203-like isoform X3 [Orbicella faveolata]
MAATAMFQRRNIDLFKTIILRLPRSRFCSADSSDEEQPNENISDDPETVLQGKKLDLVVPSLRVDRVLASALGIGRSKVKDYVLSRNVYLNKQITSKAASEVNEGDEIDLTRSKEDDKLHCCNSMQNKDLNIKRDVCGCIAR